MGAADLLVTMAIGVFKGGVQNYTANMCREITVKLQSKKCNSEKLQFFTVGHSSLYFLQVKNCNFSIIFL